MISILITSRVEGNINHGLKKLLNSLSTQSHSPDKIEVLIKFDTDDQIAMSVEADILAQNYPFKIKTAYGPRGRGYIDIHQGYNNLLPMISRESRVIGAMADDFIVNRHWDEAVRLSIEGAGKFFIIHQRPHPPNGSDYNRPDKFRMDADMFNAEDIHIIDEAPLWSPALIQAVEGFPVSFTDAWTLCLEYSLWHIYGINITKFLPGIMINRTTCEVDQPGNERWHTDRRINFDFIKSNEFKEIVEEQAWFIDGAIKSDKN